MMLRRWLRFVVQGLVAAIAFGLVVLLIVDPLERLRVSLALRSLAGSTNWRSGMFVSIELPSSAKPEEVLNNYLSRRLLRIVELKRITIPSPAPGDHHYWAAIVRMDDGRNLTFLFQYQPGPSVLHPAAVGTWWVKELD